MKDEIFVSDLQLEMMKQAKREGFELAITLIRKQYEGFKGLVSYQIVSDVIEVEGLELGILK